MVPHRSQTLMDKYLKTADTDWYKQRITGVIVCALAAFVVLFIRLIVLQVIMGDEYRRLSLNNSIRLQNIDPPRGRLYDRNGDLLVDNRPSFDVNITLKDAEPLKPTLEKLALHLNTPADALWSQIKQKRGVSAYSPLLLQQDVGRKKSALSHFLLQSRAGHCEYFATATVLLLRAAGIPARYCRGYAVQEFSKLENRFIVRDRHAHAWTLAYVDGIWTNFDTTPG